MQDDETGTISSDRRIAEWLANRRRRGSSDIAASLLAHGRGALATDAELRLYQEAGFNVVMAGRCMQLDDYADAAFRREKLPADNLPFVRPTAWQLSQAMDEDLLVGILDQKGKPLLAMVVDCRTSKGWSDPAPARGGGSLRPRGRAYHAVRGQAGGGQMVEIPETDTKPQGEVHAGR